MLIEEGVVLSGESTSRPMRASDLVVFEHSCGGRCVRIQTACPHHVCVVIMESDKHMHCNVFPDCDSLKVDTLPGVALLRLVPYSRRGIDAFIEAVKNQPELWEEALPLLDVRLHERAEISRLRAICAQYDEECKRQRALPYSCITQKLRHKINSIMQPRNV
jgi:hypothetical protein